MKKKDADSLSIHICLWIIIMLLAGICGRLKGQNLDINLLRSINTPHELRFDGTFRTISNSDYFVVVAIPLTLFICGEINTNAKTVNNGCILIMSTAATFALTEITKDIVKRQRPFVTYKDILNKSRVATLDPSFPSGHTSSAFNTATFVSLSYPKWYIIAPSFVYAGAVAYSRMYLGVHYPSDVLAGAALGAGTAWLTYYINKKLNKKS
jgi:undecaprenyl-diphosphatase